MRRSRARHWRGDAVFLLGLVAAAALALLPLAVAGAQQAAPQVAPQVAPQTALQARSHPVSELPGASASVVPETCPAVPAWADHLRLEGQDDTTFWTPERDRLAPEVRAELARCVAAAGPKAVHPWQHLALGRAELALGNDAAAQRWLERYLASVARAPLAQRAWAQHLVVGAYAEARPPRFAAAEVALRALDALGPPAARARVLAHFKLMEAARRHWRDTLRVRAADACLGAYRELPAALRGLVAGPAAGCVVGQAEVALRHQGRAPALAILDSGLALLPTSPPLRSARQRYALVGTPAPVIEATRWFRREGAEPKPARGVVTLLHAVDHSNGSAAQYQALRRLAARFAGRPVELIAQTKTLGFFSDSGSGASMPPEREMALDSAYFYGYAGLPGMLAVAATRFTIGADGWRREQPTPQEQHYQGAPVVLIDRRGLVRYVGLETGDPGEGTLVRLIETLLAEP